MKTTVLAAGIVALALAGAASSMAQPAPDPDPMAGFYGATLRIEAKGYRELRFYEPDHSFRNLARGKTQTGVWSIEGDKICAQVVGAARFCNLGLGKTPGETWVDHDPYTGNPVTFTLEPGRKADR